MTGMLLRSREAVIGVYTLFMLPLMFLSSAFMQPGFLPGWMQAIASRNPLNWEVQIGRDVLAATTDWPAVAVRTGGLPVLAARATGRGGRWHTPRLARTTAHGGAELHRDHPCPARTVGIRIIRSSCAASARVIS